MDEFLAALIESIGSTKAIQDRNTIIAKVMTKFSVPAKAAGDGLAKAIVKQRQIENPPTITDKIISDRVAGRRRRIAI